jgi:hypothetical protein
VEEDLRNSRLLALSLRACGFSSPGSLLADVGCRGSAAPPPALRKGSAFPRGKLTGEWETKALPPGRKAIGFPQGRRQSRSPEFGSSHEDSTVLSLVSLPRLMRKEWLFKRGWIDWRREAGRYHGPDANLLKIKRKKTFSLFSLFPTVPFLEFTIMAAGSRGYPRFVGRGKKRGAKIGKTKPRGH